MTHVDLHESCRKKKVGCRRKILGFEEISTDLVGNKSIECIPNRFKSIENQNNGVTKGQNFPLRGAEVTFTWFSLINSGLGQNLPTPSFFFYMSHVDISCRFIYMSHGFGNPKKKVWCILPPENQGFCLGIVSYLQFLRMAFLLLIVSYLDFRNRREAPRKKIGCFLL